MVGQRRDHGGAAAALAVAIQVVDAGHADVGGGRLVHARAGRADEREADRVAAAEEDQAHGLLFHLDGETEHITQERGGGPQVDAILQIGLGNSATRSRVHATRASRTWRVPAPPPGDKAPRPPSRRAAARLLATVCHFVLSR